MTRLVRSAVCLSVGFAFITSADAGPFRDFFRKVRHAFTESGKSNQSHRTSAKHTSHPNHATVSSAGGADVVSSPPNGRNTRSAIRSNGSTKADLPYGTPVPGKKGFVTSPFAPDSGYVDVRGFSPGTVVKDPYTGKTFLIP